jgi:8-oxo-dGTP diphosphatase
MPTADEVRAAGGVVVRAGRVAIVHRPRYDDWSLPKGHVDPGESFEQAALREVHEEAGLRCLLGAELEPVRYRDRHARPKLVRYWVMEVVAGEFAPNDEVDELRWVTPAEAEQLLTHAADCALVRAATRA